MPAQVYSIESIEAFRVALLNYQHRVEDALVELNSQIRRAVDWIDHDRPAHWREQAKEADRWIHDAKLDLERCLIYRATDRRPACREERVMLKKAKARWEYCRDKIERVHHWKRSLHHQFYEYQGRISNLKRILEHDIPRANAALLHILRQLEQYQLEQPPPANQTTVESQAADSLADNEKNADSHSTEDENNIR